MASPALTAVLVLAAIYSTAAMQFDLEFGRVKVCYGCYARAEAAASPSPPLPSLAQCLQEVMSKHDIAKGSFHIVDVPEGSPSGVEVKVTGPNGEVEMSRQDASSAKLGFTAAEGGAHKVCFTNTGEHERAGVQSLPCCRWVRYGY